MSHLVTVRSKLHDPTAIAAACQKLQLPIPVEGTASLFSGEVTGLLIRLPDWRFPAVVDTATGAVHFDNYNGIWGEQQHLDRFLQRYAVEKAKLEARRKGYSASEQVLQDGSIKVQIVERSQ